MHHPTDTHRTAKDLSPEALAQYRRRCYQHFQNRQVDEALLHRRRCYQHFQNRQVDEALLQRAWHTAHRIAAMLYDGFDVTHVAVFGSLAEQESFTKWSDIDIAVWGIPSDKYFRAVWEAEDISGLFKVDLVDFESCKGLFRERVQSQAIGIGKGEIYPVDRGQLIQRISDERTKIDGTVKKIEERLEKIKAAPLNIGKR